jgi:hypothetical protein
MRGLPKGKLVLCEHKADWSRIYETEAKLIHQAVGRVVMVESAHNRHRLHYLSPLFAFLQRNEPNGSQ